MKDNIATASRNVLAIKRRQATNLGFRGVRKLSKMVFGRPNDVSTLALYPSVRNRSTLRDLINRLAWYLPSETTGQCRIRIPLAAGLDPSIPETAPDGQVSYPREHLDIEFVDPDAVTRIVDDADRILCHDIYRSLGVTLLQNLARVEIVDPEFYSTVECGSWPRTLDAHRKVHRDVSRENYRRLEDQTADFDHSYVFATGPSLDEAYDFEFPDDVVTVVCNSIVRSDDLLKHIEPDVLVFSDPVFHFGPSEYAHKFREDAVEAIQDYDCVAVISDFRQSLLAGHYPKIEDRLVGVECVSSKLPRFPTHNSLDVMRTGNIMTLLMLPIASSLTDHVHIIGADGREENESYFWEHNSEAQYDDDLMETAVDTHPSFFRDRIYTDYYEKHIETLTDMIEYGERNGIKYTSLTESYVSCLQNRYNPSIES